MIHATIYVIYPKNMQNIMLYVGQTQVSIQKRWARHKLDARRSNVKVHKHIRENGGFDAFTIGVVEKRDFETKADLLNREAYHIRRIPNEICLNSIITPEWYLPQHKTIHTNAYYTKEWQDNRREYYLRFNMWNEHEQQKYDKVMSKITPLTC